MSLHEVRKEAQAIRTRAYNEFLEQYRAAAEESYHEEKLEILRLFNFLSTNEPMTAREIAEEIEKKGISSADKWEIAQNLTRIATGSTSRYLDTGNKAYIPQLENYEIEIEANRQKTIKLAEVDENGDIAENGYKKEMTIKLPNLYSISKRK